MKAAENVRERLRRSCDALENAKIAYAVIGGNAVAEWVGQVDEGAVRNTKDVDILLQRSDLDAAKIAMFQQGFIHAEVMGVNAFIDGPTGRIRDAVHIIFAGEKVQADYVSAAPPIAKSERGRSFRVVSLDALVEMKLTSYRLKDRVHILDLIGVGLIDESWLDRVPVHLQARLRECLDNRDG